MTEICANCKYVNECDGSEYECPAFKAYAESEAKNKSMQIEVSALKTDNTFMQNYIASESKKYEEPKPPMDYVIDRDGHTTRCPR